MSRTDHPTNRVIADIDPRDFRAKHAGEFPKEYRFTGTPNDRPYPAYRARVMTCHECHLRDYCRIPSPGEPTLGARFAVVGEGPIVKAAANLLNWCLQSAGIDRSLVASGAATCCQGRTADGHPATPDRGTQAACRRHLLDWLDPVDAVVFVGATAKDTWRPDITLEHARGGLWLWHVDDRVRLVTVIRHPVSILREKYDQRPMKLEMVDDFKRFARALDSVDKERDIRPLFGRWCVECGTNKVGYVDPDGCGWCDTHWERGLGKRNKGGGGIERWAVARRVWKDIERERIDQPGVMGLPFEGDGVAVTGRESAKPAKAVKAAKATKRPRGK